MFQTPKGVFCLSVEDFCCLITKNEEQNITRCIEGFKDSVNEIIVVDTGSIDGTVKTAKRLGARVYYYKWNNIFSDAKNYAFKQAKGP